MLVELLKEKKRACQVLLGDGMGGVSFFSCGFPVLRHVNR